MEFFYETMFPSSFSHLVARRYVYAAELAGLGYSLANTKSGVTVAVKGYSDKQGVLLDKILDKLTRFQVDTNRFNVLKEAYFR